MHQADAGGGSDSSEFGLAPSVRLIFKLELLQHTGSFKPLLVSDEAIVRAQEGLWTVLRVVAEPGAVAAFAALLTRQYQPDAGERVDVVL